MITKTADSVTVFLLQIRFTAHFKYAGNEILFTEYLNPSGKNLIEFMIKLKYLVLFFLANLIEGIYTEL